MQNILIYIKQKCQTCFGKKNRNDYKEDNQKLIDSNELELSNMAKINRISSHESQVIPNLSQSKSKIGNGEIILHKNKTSQHSQQQSSDVYSNQRKNLLAKQENNHLQEQAFYSIQQTKGSQTKPIKYGLPTRNSLNKNDNINVKMIKKTSMQQQQKEWQKNFESTQSIQSSFRTDVIISWIRRQYENERKIPFQIKYANRLKMKTKGLFTLLQHKLEDFKITYFGESSKGHLSFTNRKKKLSAHYHFTLNGTSSSNVSSIMSYYRIDCSTVNVSQLLLFFKSKQVLKVLHDFSDITLCNSEIQRFGFDIPIFFARQKGKRLKNVKNLHIAWQIGAINYEEDQNNLSQIGFSLDEGQSIWQRIIRYTINQKGCIQLYIQSLQQIGQNENEFFTDRFTKINNMLILKRLIDK